MQGFDSIIDNIHSDIHAIVVDIVIDIVSLCGLVDFCIGLKLIRIKTN